MCGTIAQFVAVLAAFGSDLGPQADGSLEQLLGNQPAAASQFEPSDPLIPPPSPPVPLLPPERLPRLGHVASVVALPLPTFTATEKSVDSPGASVADVAPSLPYSPNPLPDDLPSQPIATQRTTYDAPIGQQPSNSPSDGLEGASRQPNTAVPDTSDLRLRYILALIAMFGSWGLCVYLFWVAMQSRSRYRALLRETGDLVTP